MPFCVLQSSGNVPKVTAALTVKYFGPDLIVIRSLALMLSPHQQGWVTCSDR
jgi:hypothetical protein